MPEAVCLNNPIDEEPDTPDEPMLGLNYDKITASCARRCKNQSHVLRCLKQRLLS